MYTLFWLTHSGQESNSKCIWLYKQCYKLRVLAVKHTALGVKGHWLDPSKKLKLFQGLISRLTTSWIIKNKGGRQRPPSGHKTLWQWPSSGYFGSIFPYCSPVSGEERRFLNHSNIETALNYSPRKAKQTHTLWYSFTLYFSQQQECVRLKN